MSTQSNGKRLTILVGESDRYHRHSLATEIVMRAHAARLAGATVFRAIEGFGSSSELHTTHLLSAADDLPIAIVVVDSPERIAAFLPELEGLVDGGLVTLEDVTILHVGHEPEPGS